MDSKYFEIVLGELSEFFTTDPAVMEYRMDVFEDMLSHDANGYTFDFPHTVCQLGQLFVNDVYRSSLRSWKKIVQNYVLENTDFLLALIPEIEFLVKRMASAGLISASVAH